MTDDEGLHPDIRHALRSHRAAGDLIETVSTEPENADYGGAVVRVGEERIRVRVGKTTPTKAGHFVTVWRRDEDGVSTPFADDDTVDSLLVSVRDEDRHGSFLFPVGVLRQQGIVSGAGSAGKRGFRLYTPWTSVSSAQAVKTRRWQGEYFRESEPSDASIPS